MKWVQGKRRKSKEDFERRIERIRYPMSSAIKFSPYISINPFSCHLYWFSFLFGFDVHILFSHTQSNNFNSIRASNACRYFDFIKTTMPMRDMKYKWAYVWKNIMFSATYMWFWKLRKFFLFHFILLYNFLWSLPSEPTDAWINRKWDVRIERSRKNSTDSITGYGVSHQ